MLFTLPLRSFCSRKKLSLLLLLLRVLLDSFPLAAESEQQQFELFINELILLDGGGGVALCSPAPEAELRVATSCAAAATAAINPFGRSRWGQVYVDGRHAAQMGRNGRRLCCIMSAPPRNCAADGKEAAAAAAQDTCSGELVERNGAATVASR